WMEQRGNLCPGDIRLIADNRDGAGRHARCHVGMHDHRAGPGVRQCIRELAAIEEEADLILRGRPQRRHAVKHQPARRCLSLRCIHHRRQRVRARPPEEAGIAWHRRRGHCRMVHPDSSHQCFCAGFAEAGGAGFVCAGGVDAALPAEEPVEAPAGTLAGVALPESVLPAGAFIASGEIPSGGITTVGSTLLRTSPTCGVKSKSAVVPKICARFSTRFTPREIATCCATCSSVRLICSSTYWPASWIIRFRSPNLRRDSVMRSCSSRSLLRICSGDSLARSFARACPRSRSATCSFCASSLSFLRRAESSLSAS